MRKAYIVVGANYGDEGKGLAAYCLTKSVAGRRLNVLINGGAQRGHTVDLPDDRRHIFHHFGSGALAGADSCADRDFIVNPLLYREEQAELMRDFALSPRLFVSEDCRVSLPYDMILGQIIEESRGAFRHGSCGLGIFETRKRFEDSPRALRWGALKNISEKEYAAYCESIINEYIPARLKSMGVAADEDWLGILSNRELMLNSYDDLSFMAENCETYAAWPKLAEAYDGIVFEAGQGLMLDEFNTPDFPHLTPSRTTSYESVKRVTELGGETDALVVYVTRSYFTRHGAGPFPGECEKAKINPDMRDLTNVPNPHQQTLRYGCFDMAALHKRTKKDLADSRKMLKTLKSAILVTHLNETRGALAGAGELKSLLSEFDEAYLSDSPCAIRPA